jgi:murein DD-endopeptidase MepM/ murein hydrolase activator NlpD
VKQLFAVLLLSLLVLSSSYAADSKYTLTYESPVKPGDLLTLTGKERFNRGQMRNIAFHIGPMVVAAQFVSPDEVRLVAPDLDDGTYPVSVIKHDTNPGRDIVLFSQNVEIVSAREKVLATTSGTINSGNGEVVLPGVAAIEAVEDTSRPTSTFTIEHVESRGDAALFKSLLLAGENYAGKKLPPLVAPTFVRLTTTNGFTGFVTVRVKVDPAFLASIPAGLAPEIYARTYSGGAADDELITDLQGLDASYDPVTGELSAPVPGILFTTEETPSIDPPPGARSVAANDVAVKQVVLQVSVKNVSVQICFDGTVTYPPAATAEATPNDVLPMKAQLTFTVPDRLGDPTLHHPSIKTGNFGGAHTGVDLKSADGDPVYAAMSGYVSNVLSQPVNPKKKNWQGIPKGGGETVILSTLDDRIKTGYAHLQLGSIGVIANQVIGVGTQIANADSTGGVTGPHLHLSYTICDMKIDAWPFLTAAGPTAFDFYDQFYAVTVVNGSVVPSSKREVSQFTFTNGKFDYSAPVDLGALKLTPGKSVPLEMRLVAKSSGKMTTFYKGTLKVKAAGLRVRLTWDTAGTDVDLHVTDSLGRHAFYANRTAIPGGTLDRDDVDGFGPETFTLAQRADGVTYAVSVHYYSDHGQGPTTARVEVYVDGVLKTDTQVGLTNNQTVPIGTY